MLTHASVTRPDSRNPTPEKRLPEGRGLCHSLPFIVALALGVRLLVITLGHTYRITPRGDHFQFGWEMGRIARSIATGHGFSSPTDLPTGPSAWAPPVYPYLLAGVFKMFGVYTAASAWVILSINSIFAALTCWTLYRIGERFFGASVARAAAWTWAVFPYIVYYPVRVVWETSLSAFLLSLGLLLTIKAADLPRGKAFWAGFGALWGMIALTNTAMLSVLPVCLVWYWFRAQKRAFAEIAICLFAAGLLVSPWLIRNYEVFGRFILIRDNMPLELQVANNPQSDALWTRSEHPGNSPEAMKRFQQLGELRYMDEKRDEVRQFIEEHPWDFARFSLKHVAYFWMGNAQTSLIGSYNFMVARHTMFLLATAFTLAGLWLASRRQKYGWALLGSVLLIYPLPYYLVSPFTRYRHAIEPVMILLMVFLFYEARRINLSWRP